MTDLLRSDTGLKWDTQQEAALEAAKRLTSLISSLQYYRLTRDVNVRADASHYVISARLLQRDPSTKRLLTIAFASCTLTLSEGRYAQIEKEWLTLLCACEMFHKYLVGLPEFEL